jgi:thioredoxin reductase (NADPH)
VDELDVVVVGGGVAGSSAALTAARSGLRTVMLAPEGPLGTLSTIERVTGFPGLGEISGYELCPMLNEQAVDAGTEMRMNWVEGLARADERWHLSTSEGDLVAKAVIAATGTRAEVLGVPGEQEFVGRGVSHCASCDGPLFAGKRVAVVGGGDSALQEALTLLEHGVAVTILQLDEELTAQDAFVTELRAHRSVEVRYRSRVQAVLGTDTVSGVRVRDESNGTEREDEFEGVFVYVGREPVSEWLGASGVLDQRRRVMTDAAMRTTAPGLFAAGDLRAESPGHAASACGDGVSAAYSANDYIRSGLRSA